MPEARLNYIYIACNSLDAMHHFYSELVGLEESSYREGADGWLVYTMGGFEFMIFPASNPLPVHETWSSQPGWLGGELEVPSWSIEIPAEQFATTVERLKSGGVPTWSATPMWCMDSYWSFPVRDPMGNTVEIHTIPAERPASTEWQG